MATGTLSPSPKFTGFDDNGDPLVGGKLYTYAAGTTTPLATYSDVGLTTANANPTILDAGGRCTLFLSATSYKFVLKTSADATVWTQDNIGAVPTNNIDTDVTGTAGAALTATQVAYLDTSTWKLADADAVASSTAPPIGFVVSDIASGASGAFRIAGRMTGFSGLTPGADYYVSGTAGAITSTAPANARYVGRADSISSLIVLPNPPVTPTIDPRIKSMCNGRLSLTTGVPVTSADVTAATTLYWVPYQGNSVALYSGSAWVVFQQAQLSIAAPAVANTNSDVFMDYNSGTPALALKAWRNSGQAITGATNATPIVITANSHGLSNGDQVYISGVLGNTAANGTWTVANVAANTFELTGSVGNGAYTAATGYFNARASDGLLTTQDGVLVLTGSTGKRYVGTVRTVTASQFNDSALLRHCWNYYNRVSRRLQVLETTNSWAYTTATWRQARATATNQVDVVIGVAEVEIDLDVAASADNGSSVNIGVAIGLDSTTAPAANQQVIVGVLGPGSGAGSSRASYRAYPAVGRHFFAWLEFSTATGTTTWYSNGNATLSMSPQSGILGTIQG